MEHRFRVVKLVVGVAYIYGSKVDCWFTVVEQRFVVSWLSASGRGT